MILTRIERLYDKQSLEIMQTAEVSYERGS